jgi:hypothetical protein
MFGYYTYLFHTLQAAVLESFTAMCPDVGSVEFSVHFLEHVTLADPTIAAVGMSYYTAKLCHHFGVDSQHTTTAPVSYSQQYNSNSFLICVLGMFWLVHDIS